MKTDYVIITPAKDEAAFIGQTIESVVKQTLLPKRWIIVDDGSTDNTVAVIRDAIKDHPWIDLVEHPTAAEERSGGAKVVRAFQFGFNKLKESGYDFIVKLDGDLSLPPEYFEKVADQFDRNPRLGICGGYILNLIDGKLINEKQIDYHVRGAFKSVRKTCFDDIGGFRPIWNWDGIDEMDAMLKGWTTKVIDCAVIHFRPTSGAYNPIKFHYKDGYKAYKLRSSVRLTFVRSLVRLMDWPYLISGTVYMAGYLHAFVKLEDYIVEKKIARFTNQFHLKRIMSWSEIKKFLRHHWNNYPLNPNKNKIDYSN